MGTEFPLSPTTTSFLAVHHKYWNPSTTKSRDTFVKISLLTDIRNQGIFSMMVRTIIERKVKHDVYGKQ